MSTPIVDFEQLLSGIRNPDPILLSILRHLGKENKDIKHLLSKMRYFHPPTYPDRVSFQSPVAVLDSLPTDAVKQFLADSDYSVFNNGYTDAIPAVGSWYQENDIAGAGLYKWDIEEFVERLFYTVIATSTKVQFNKNGKYLVIGKVGVNGATANTNVLITLYKNAALMEQFSTIANTTGNVGIPILRMLDIIHGDTISVELTATTGGDRDGGQSSSYLSIYRLN